MQNYIRISVRNHTGNLHKALFKLKYTHISFMQRRNNVFYLAPHTVFIYLGGFRLCAVTISTNSPGTEILRQN